MNISVTIPQLFYDFIARILPGFLFLFMLNFELATVNINISDFVFIDSSANSMATFINALGFVVLSYFGGWILSAFIFSDMENFFREYCSHNEKTYSMYELYDMQHKIRLKSESAGFRIVKLRAEARMLESSAIAMFMTVGITLLLFSLFKLSLTEFYNQSYLTWFFKLIIPLVMAMSFQRLGKKAWDRYFGNVINHFEIIFEQADNQQNACTQENSVKIVGKNITRQ